MDRQQLKILAIRWTLGLNLVLLALPRLAGEETPPIPLANAHSHNDYLHPRPLVEALENGYASVEADIFLVDGELLIGHEPKELRKDRTLESLYLKPLLELSRRNQGQIFKDGPQFFLWIDIKSEASSTYAALEKLLGRYAELLTYVQDGKEERRAVTAVISGNRDWKAIAADPQRRAGLDGRIEDLDSDLPSHLLPAISDRWGKIFQWRGSGPMPEPEKRRLKEIVRKAHDRGRRVRFWATPEDPAVWKELLEAGVDFLNTDKLAELRKFLLENDPALKTRKTASGG
jgi:hypothetical protein